MSVPATPAKIHMMTAITSFEETYDAHLLQKRCRELASVAWKECAEPETPISSPAPETRTPLLARREQALAAAMEKMQLVKTTKEDAKKRVSDREQQLLEEFRVKVLQGWQKQKAAVARAASTVCAKEDDYAIAKEGILFATLMGNEKEKERHEKRYLRAKDILAEAQRKLEVAQHHEWEAAQAVQQETWKTEVQAKVARMLETQAKAALRAEKEVATRQRALQRTEHVLARANKPKRLTRKNTQVNVDLGISWKGSPIYLRDRMVKYHTHTGVTVSAFPSSVTFCYTTAETGRRSIKLFYKGTVHLTGFKSLSEIQETVGPLCTKILFQIGCLAAGEERKIQEVRIININAQFYMQLPKTIPLSLFTEWNLDNVLSKGWKYDYEAEMTMAHLRVKTSSCTYMISPSGSVTMSGLKSEEAISREREAFLAAGFRFA